MLRPCRTVSKNIWVVCSASADAPNPHDVAAALVNLIAQGRVDLCLGLSEPWSSTTRSNRCNAIDLDIETSGPCGHVHENPCRWLGAKETCIDFIDDREHLDGCAADVALKHLVKRRSASLDADLQLLQHASGLLFDWRIQYLAGLRIEWRQARHVKRVAVTRGTEVGAFQRSSQLDNGSTRMISRAMCFSLSDGMGSDSVAT